MQKKLNSYHFFSLACAITLVLVNVIRIFRVPVTFDEVSYLSNITAPYSDIIHLKLVTANTHILNSILRKFFIETFANTPFFLRLDNLLAQIVFLATSYFTCRQLFKNERWVTAVFLCLNLNPFLFDFWGLSRGYGLSVAFMMAAIYFLIRYQKDEKVYHLIFCFLCCITSVYSNFSLLNFTVAVAGIIFIGPLLKRDKSSLKKSAIKALPLTALAASGMYALVHEPINKLRDGRQFFHGGEAGIVHDTIASVVKESLFISNEASKGVMALSYVIAFSILAAGVCWIYKIIKNKTGIEELYGLSLWLLLVIPLAETEVLHKAYETKYLIDRAALFLMVLYVLQLCYWLYYLALKQHRIYSWAMAGLLCLVSFNFLKNINLDSTWEWQHDKNTLVVLNKMMQESGNKKEKIKVCANWIFEPSLDYYISTIYKDKFQQTCPLDFPLDTTADYVYLTHDDLEKVPKSYVTDTTFTIKNTILYEGRYLLMRKRNLTSITK